LNEIAELCESIALSYQILSDYEEAQIDPDGSLKAVPISTLVSTSCFGRD
jgi:hypothetical protein